MPNAPICPFARRVLSRLVQAEARELNPHFQSDIRIAWITVLHVAEGLSAPDVAASYAVLGLHPDKVWPAIVARRQALLGPHYADFWGARSTEPSLPPKKPVRSEKCWPRAQQDAA